MLYILRNFLSQFYKSNEYINDSSYFNSVESTHKHTHTSIGIWRMCYWHTLKCVLFPYQWYDSMQNKGIFHKSKSWKIHWIIYFLFQENLTIQQRSEKNGKGIDIKERKEALIEERERALHILSWGLNSQVIFFTICVLSMASNQIFMQMHETFHMHMASKTLPFKSS